jgi:2-polyprenyl-3-methyl-5-hydroxy-6-metoxy-1,4-benzoquinol methylase
MCLVPFDHPEWRSIMDYATEISAGERFQFGENWKRYLLSVDQAKLEAAKASLAKMLGDLDGCTFLDVGSGSGLFSLAARELGATVRSFDYDPNSVECTRLMKQRFAPEQRDWSIEQGSVLDDGFLRGLGQHDVVYAWGVLHHTGDMWAALDKVTTLVKPSGRLWLAIYNDQGEATHIWKRVKRAYNGSSIGKAAVLGVGMPFLMVRTAAADLVRMRNPFSRYRQSARGMAAFADLVDWLGGWPFEVAKPEEIFEFYTKRGFTLHKLRTCAGRAGCNEFLFVKQGL